MKRIMACLIAGGVLLAGMGTAAAAGPAPAVADTTTAETPFGEAAKVAGDDLAAITGREDTNMVIRAQNSSNVSGNSVIGQSQTGTINFDSQTMQNLSGLSLLSANTGNNVSINSSLNVNVAIHP